jgi:surface antigen
MALCLLALAACATATPPARDIGTVPDDVLQLALETRPSGEAVPFRSTEAGASGTVMPVRTWRSSEGGYCRDYAVTLGDGSMEGTACRDAGGVWRPVTRGG